MKMMLSTVVLFLTLMVVCECTKLPENHDVITELTDVMQRLEAKFFEAEERAAKTEEEMKLMKQETSEVATDLSEAIHRLEAKFAGTEAKKDEELREIKRENSRMIAELTDTVLTQDADIYAKLSEFTENQASQQVDSAVGFSVYTEDGYHYPAQGSIIRFPHIMTNIGEHYDPIESMFTCPIDGTYYFTFSLNTGSLGDSDLTYAYIVRGGELLSNAYCQSHIPNTSMLTQCVNSVVTHCNQDQLVHVVSFTNDAQLYGYYRRSTFSGFLIHADTPPY